MRKKHKARGRAERTALEQVAAEAGVEIVDEPGEASAADGPASEGDADPDTADTVDGEDSRAAVDDLAASTTTDELTPPDAGDATGDGAPAGGQMADRADLDLDHTADELSGDLGEETEDAEDAGPVDPAQPQAAALDEVRFKQLIEALVFASDKPLTIARLRQLTRVSDTRRIQLALDQLVIDHADSGIVLSAVSGGYSFRTHSSFSSWVQQLIAGRPVRLSRAQLETLAIVAYRQPITRPEIDQIRGVDSGATLKLLLDRSLVRILGKREEVGRPLLYGTTKEFLDFFSLSELRELPTLREYSELTAESRSLVAKLGGEPLPAMVEPGEGEAVGEGDGAGADAAAAEAGGEVAGDEPAAGDDDVAADDDAEAGDGEVGAGPALWPADEDPGEPALGDDAEPDALIDPDTMPFTDDDGSARE